MTVNVRPTIQEALSKVMGDVQAVGKDGRNTSQNFNFRGVDAVVNAVGPALREHGVIVLPKVTEKSYSTYQAGSQGKTTMHECLLTVEYTFVGPDGSTLVCSAPGESADAGDKATAKAMSVAYRTALLQALCIPTDEPDPDQAAIERAPAEDPEVTARKQAWRALRTEVAAHHPGEDDDEQKAIAQAIWDEHGKNPKRLNEMIAAADDIGEGSSAENGGG